MQLPLSASALVMLGVAAVLVGASILGMVAVRRKKPARGPARIPPDMRRVPQQPAATSGPNSATADVEHPATRPHLPATLTAPPAPELPAAPVAAAATPRPVEVVARVEPPDPPELTRPAETPAVPRHPQAGSGRTVAAAVAQAFAVRAAAGRAGASGPGLQPPAGPLPAGVDDRADDRADDSATAAQETAPAQPDPVPGEDLPSVPAADVDGVDPAATTDPDGSGLAAMAGQGSDGEPRAAEVEAPEAAVSGNGWVAAAAYGSNGDHAPDGNGRSEPATVPAPRPGNDGVARQDGSVSDARDRLLAVLLDDPEQAVGAAVELETCLHELDRLSDAVRAGRAALRDVLHRLAAAGLRPEQLARLARMPQAEVEALLEAALSGRTLEP
jgi:hypothetical protein